MKPPHCKHWDGSGAKTVQMFHLPRYDYLYSSTSVGIRCRTTTNMLKLIELGTYMDTYYIGLFVEKLITESTECEPMNRGARHKLIGACDS
jgi:hypothetical protein